jgi:hypothetical protein
LSLLPTNRSALPTCPGRYYIAKIKASGGTIISHSNEGALKFRAPDGTVAEIVGVGRYKKKSEKEMT